MSRPTRDTPAGRAYLDLQNHARREKRGTQEVIRRANTNADDKKSVWNLFWERSGSTYKIYARDWCSGVAFDADEVADRIDGGLPALARDFLSRLHR